MSAISPSLVSPVAPPRAAFNTLPLVIGVVAFLAGLLLMGWIVSRSDTARGWLSGSDATPVAAPNAPVPTPRPADPLALVRRTGLLGFLSFQLFIGGALVFALVTPPLWLAFLAGLQFGGDDLTPGPAIPGAGLLVSNVLLTLLAVLAPRRRGWETLAPYGLTVVLYWAMISVAGYRGLWQLFTRPFFWEKTEHGVTAV